MKIVFVGPSSSVEKISGGLKRFREAYCTLSKLNIEVSCCEIVSITKGLFSNSIRYIVFDERYLTRLLVLLLFKKEVIFFPRGNKIIHYEFSYSKTRLYFYKLLFSYLYSRCLCLVFQTEAQRLEFKEMYSYTGKYKVLPNNLNTSWMQPLIAHRKSAPYEIENLYSLNVGFLGGLNERKGFDLLYHSLMPFIQDESVILSVGGASRDNFDKYKIIALGELIDDKLLSFYKSNDVVMIPSRYDSFPNVFLEALASGCIPLIARTPITEDILGKESCLLFERTDKGISDIIYQIQTDKKFSRTLKVECYKQFENHKFDWSKRIENIILSKDFF